MPLPVTVCIPARNEEQNLPGCLDALRGAFADVVVIDSASTDATREVAEARGAKVLEFAWDGKFPKKRNWVLRNHAFETPWVLFLDADEQVTEPFLDELRATLGGTPHVGFWISFNNWFMGRPLRHGDVFRKLALFRVGAGEYERFPEDRWSHLDMEVHEHPVLQGSVGALAARLDHHDYRGLKHYIAKHNEYSSWEAHRFVWLKTAGAEYWNSLNKRQRFKYRNLNRWWFARFYFATTYFAKLGFLDGWTGWVFNQFKLRYFQDIRLKIRELESGDV
ncbi:MAG: glycosyltransferase family 2 protein [Planctomyces sp.]|nr:glycosyltransferase family 2 protein [Planctomyces sp.]